MVSVTNDQKVNWSLGVWPYRARRTIEEWDLTPLQITLIYMVFGFAALYLSDVVFVQLIDDPALLQQVQAVKGGVEVVATGGLIFVLTHRSRRSLTRANDRLQQQQEELQVLHRLFRHNLRNTMNIIHGYTASLHEELDTQRHREWCATMLDVADQIIHYTEQADKIQKVTHDGDFTVTDVADTVTQVIDSHPEITEQTQVETSLPETALVEANKMLSEALTELLRNAIVHNDTDHPEVMLSVDPEAGPSHMTEITVADNGPGIPQHVKQAIQQRNEDQLIHLDGIGMWFVFWTITSARGEFMIEDREPRGARIRFHLPKAMSRFTQTSVPTLASATG